MKRLCLIFFVSLATRAEIYDRVVVAVDYQAITERQLDEELRVTAFLNKTPVVRDRVARHAAAERLIQQALIQKEMELSRYSPEQASDLAQYIKQVETALGGQERVSQEIARYELTEQVLREHLALQLTMITFIQQRFRPNAVVTDSEIQQAYKAEKYNRAGSGTAVVPPSERELVRQALLDRRSDELLNNWLTEARDRSRVVYLDPLLK